MYFVEWGPIRVQKKLLLLICYEKSTFQYCHPRKCSYFKQLIQLGTITGT
jgi:hypothetical protein